MNDSALRKPHASNHPIRHDEINGFVFHNLQIRLLTQRILHRLGVEFSIGLRPWASHGWAFGAIENAELNSCGISHSPHQPVKRVNLSDKMTFSKPADGWIT